MKILHTADIHLDSPLRSLALRDPALGDRVRTASRTALTRIIDMALAERVAAVLIAGDLFDGAERSARTAAFLTLQLERLREQGIGVFYIKGNHDAENPLTGAVALPDNVHVFDGRGGKVPLGEGVWIHGVSFASRHAPDSLLPKFPAPVPGAINIAMLHTSLTGAEGHDPYAPCTLGDLTTAGFDYWALGHVHRRQVHATAPWVVMPGTPQGRDMGEAGPKSATLLTVGETIEIEEVQTSAVEFSRITVDVEDADSPESLRALLKRTLRHIARDLMPDSAVIRLELTGRTALRWQILRDRDVWTDTVAQYATETGRLYIDKIVFDLSDTAAPGHTATDELAAIMEAIRDEPAFAETCRAEIDAILQELPAQRRAALLPDETAMDGLARRLATSGAAQILARLRGSTA